MERTLTRTERIVRWAVRKLQRIEEDLAEKQWAKADKKKGS